MARIRLPTRNNLYISNSSKTLKMSVPESISKRPVCPSCSKPSGLCICTRIQNPGLDNKVNLTILQHSLEKKHPLNSVRIAKLGFKNVNIVNISDVNFGAQFVIRLPEPASGLTNGLERFDFYNKESQERKFDDVRSINTKRLMSSTVAQEVSICFNIIKYGVISDLIQVQEMINFDQILSSKIAIDARAKGFIVKKLQKKQFSGSIGPSSVTDFEGLEEDEEFELKVPRGSVLLFPSDEAVGVDELKELNFKVKNLIILDGTWAKAKRMYKENPWLKFLPHLRLDLDKLSLYGEVRHQPNAGCLSTIESIVYALKALEDNPQGLDGLLDVFESMVDDQRRCKNERLCKVS